MRSVDLTQKSLKNYVKPQLLRLKQRLNKEGFADITCLENEKYRRTSLWKCIREWILVRDDYKCVICCRSTLFFSGDIHVHHRRYCRETLEGARDDFLVSLCEMCHEKIEKYDNGLKRHSQEEKDEVFFRLKNIFSHIQRNGITVVLKDSFTRGYRCLEIGYEEQDNLYELYPIKYVFRPFLHIIMWKYKGQFSYPIWPESKLKFKSGLRILDKLTKKIILQIVVNEQTAVLRVPKDCKYSFKDDLMEAMRLWSNWHIKEVSVL